MADAKPKVAELHILWISEGMSCDGDTISITAASQPSIEDVLLGLVPGLPTVHLHNKCLAPENGDDFIAPFWQAARGELDAPFVLVIEGSIPNENIHDGEGYWTGFGVDPNTDQPKKLTTWIDELAPKAADELMKKEMTIVIDLGFGDGHQATMWTCDFSAEYVKINAEYRT